jgi:ribonuclease P protein component
VRNRVKRRLREIFRRRIPLPPRGYDFFVRATPASAHASYAELDRAWHEAMGEFTRQDARRMTGATEQGHS